MADYQLVLADADAMVIRTADWASIPNDPLNRDWLEYQDWLAAGGIPDAPPKPIVLQPAPETSVLFDHENRLLRLEGKSPIKLTDFLDKMATP